MAESMEQSIIKYRDEVYGDLIFDRPDLFLQKNRFIHQPIFSK
jgi:hypothetical protein